METLFLFQKMNFSELFRQSNQICKFSPDGKYLASVVEFRLVVRDVATFQVSCWVDCVNPWGIFMYYSVAIPRPSDKSA